MRELKGSAAGQHLQPATFPPSPLGYAWKTCWIYAAFITRAALIVCNCPAFSLSAQPVAEVCERGKERGWGCEVAERESINRRNALKDLHETQLAHLLRYVHLLAMCVVCFRNWISRWAGNNKQAKRRARPRAKKVAAEREAGWMEPRRASRRCSSRLKPGDVQPS